MRQVQWHSRILGVLLWRWDIIVPLWNWDGGFINDLQCISVNIMTIHMLKRLLSDTPEAQTYLLCKEISSHSNFSDSPSRCVRKSIHKSSLCFTESAEQVVQVFWSVLRRDIRNRQRLAEEWIWIPRSLSYCLRRPWIPDVHPVVPSDCPVHLVRRRESISWLLTHRATLTLRKRGFVARTDVPSCQIMYCRMEMNNNEPASPILPACCSTLLSAELL